MLTSEGSFGLMLMMVSIHGSDCSSYLTRKKRKVESRKEGRSDSAAMATHRIEWLRLGLIPVQILLSGRQVLVCIIHREQRHLGQQKGKQ